MEPECKSFLLPTSESGEIKILRDFSLYLKVKRLEDRLGGGFNDDIF
jgi:hypothetical protein